MEISHAELEKYHYQALKNPQYQLEGMMSVLYEELMMSMPLRQPEKETIIEVQDGVPWKVHDNLKAKVLFLERKLNEHTAYKKKRMTPW